MKFNFENGLDGEEFLRNRAIYKYNAINKKLSTYVEYYSNEINKPNLDKAELEKIDLKLQRRIDLLKDELKRTMWEHPDAATDLTEFEVIKNGERYTVNKGLEEKINQRYEDIIKSLENKLKIIEFQLENYPENKKELQDLFDKKKAGYAICLELFKEFEIIDSNTNRCTICKEKSKKGFLLFALIDAFKKMPDKDQLLSRNSMSDEELLDYFNSYLGAKFKQIKRDSAGYKEYFPKARNFIKAALKK